MLNYIVKLFDGEEYIVFDAFLRNVPESDYIEFINKNNLIVALFHKHSVDIVGAIEESKITSMVGKRKESGIIDDYAGEEFHNGTDIST